MYHFIVNPVSRSGKGLKLWQQQIEPELKTQNIEYSVEFSKERGDVTNIVAKISSAAKNESNCIILILGGDGTVNDAVQGIKDFENTTLAYIPTGSSNDFARDLKLPKSVKKNLRRILSAKAPVLMDVGQVETERGTRRFAVSSGLGFDGAVCQKSVHSILKKRLNKIGLGKLTYLGIALNQIINAPKVDAEITFADGKKINAKNLLFFAAMVHKYEGGGFKFCPKADAYDGELDFICAANKTVPGILLALPTAFFGFHSIFKGIDIYRFKTAEIKTSIPLWLHTDGEVGYKAQYLNFSQVDEKLKFIL
ncbi:diacylglycerol/lipid kinase family protein [Treponema sp.]|uniref:diacylglycerol/lipid kinase family protein n=1 Tax=Treponema sp. TaxID=166 RepID=UPI00298E5879|nr:YegS/Rv2252/BmrU family lipid kinase [Treponema sp.]